MWLASAHGDPNPASAEQGDDEAAGRDSLSSWYFPGAVTTDVRGSERWLAMLPDLES